MASYNAVKAAVVALTETTGHELAAYGVTAHVVCPSYFRTNLMSSMQGRDETLGKVIASLVENSPITADDIAAAVLEGLDRGDELIVPDRAGAGRLRAQAERPRGVRPGDAGAGRPARQPRPGRRPTDD